MNEYSSVGAARAVQKHDMEDQIQVVGGRQLPGSSPAYGKRVSFKGIVVQREAFKMGLSGCNGDCAYAAVGKPYDENVNSGCRL